MSSRGLMSERATIDHVTAFSEPSQHRHHEPTGDWLLVLIAGFGLSPLTGGHHRPAEPHVPPGPWGTRDDLPPDSSRRPRVEQGVDGIPIVSRLEPMSDLGNQHIGLIGILLRELRDRLRGLHARFSPILGREESRQAANVRPLRA